MRPWQAAECPIHGLAVQCRDSIEWLLFRRRFSLALRLDVGCYRLLRGSGVKDGGSRRRENSSSTFRNAGFSVG